MVELGLWVSFSHFMIERQSRILQRKKPVIFDYTVKSVDINAFEIANTLPTAVNNMPAGIF